MSVEPANTLGAEEQVRLAGPDYNLRGRGVCPLQIRARLTQRAGPPADLSRALTGPSAAREAVGVGGLRAGPGAGRLGGRGHGKAGPGGTWLGAQWAGDPCAPPPLLSFALSGLPSPLPSLSSPSGPTRERKRSPSSDHTGSAALNSLQLHFSLCSELVCQVDRKSVV